MIDPFIRKQPYLIKGLADKLLLTPIDIPVIIVCLLVHSVC